MSDSIRLVERSYIAANKLCLDYAVFFSKNGEERFCGYYRSRPTIEEIDYDALHKAYDKNVEMPEWVKDNKQG